MEINIKEIFERANMHQIREFLVSGLELDGELDKRSYSERLEEGSLHIVNRIKNTAKDEAELDRVYSEFTDATDEYMQVFLEIGMKVGARLLAQMLFQDDYDK
ncbi:MAG: hypothetical protein FWD71_00265 [Oscillospiraceae bacterium]|nr:hypothetical protein [Oscillospiraceae bacterium]